MIAQTGDYKFFWLLSSYFIQIEQFQVICGLRAESSPAVGLKEMVNRYESTFVLAQGRPGPP